MGAKYNRLDATDWMFIKYYRRFGNALEAYKKSGKKVEGLEEANLKQRAYGVLGRQSIKRQLKQMDREALVMQEARDNYALDWLRSEHRRLGRKAECQDNLSEARLNLEAIGRTIGAYKDVGVNLEVVKQYEADVELEGKRLAKMLLTGEVPKGLPGRDEEVVDTDDACASQGGNGDGGGKPKSVVIGDERYWRDVGDRDYNERERKNAEHRGRILDAGQSLFTNVERAGAKKRADKLAEEANKRKEILHELLNEREFD